MIIFSIISTRQLPDATQALPQPHHHQQQAAHTRHPRPRNIKISLLLRQKVMMWECATGTPWLSELARRA